MNYLLADNIVKSAQGSPQIAPALGFSTAAALPVKLQVKLGIWLVLVARSYRKLNEKTLENPMKSADNCPVGKRKEAGHYSGLNEN